MNRFKIIWGIISSKQNIFLYEFTRSLIIFIFKLLIIFIYYENNQLKKFISEKDFDIDNFYQIEY